MKTSGTGYQSISIQYSDLMREMFGYDPVKDFSLVRFDMLIDNEMMTIVFKEEGGQGFIEIANKNRKKAKEKLLESFCRK